MLIIICTFAKEIQYRYEKTYYNVALYRQHATAYP